MLVLTLALGSLLGGPRQAAAPVPGFALLGGNVFTADRDQPMIHNGVVLVQDGKITAVGRMSEVEIPADFETIDARDGWIVPGFVECHNHTGASLGDLNDGVFGTNGDLRTVDVVEPDNALIQLARTGGVSTLLLIPGSGNNMSGFGTILKSFGSTPDEVIVRSPGSLKIAQGDNPKRYWYRQERSFMNFSLRHQLSKARRYVEAWDEYEAGRGPRPRFEPGLEDFKPLFHREIPASVHTQRYQLVMKSILMLHDEFGLWTMLDHSTMSGFLAAPLAVERDLDVIVGPRQLHFSPEDRKIHGCAAEWWERGVRKVGINTDAPVIPERELPYQAAMAVHFGLPKLAALFGLTLVPAVALGLEDRVGSLAPGKDADIGIWSGNPLDPASRCDGLLVNGQPAYRYRAPGR